MVHSVELCEHLFFFVIVEKSYEDGFIVKSGEIVGMIREDAGDGMCEVSL